ncbi:MAG: signal peptidase II [Lachnospiraceae bacterium]|nr:signal peptidase II [Lachnospiraceae bacterium]
MFHLSKRKKKFLIFDLCLVILLIGLDQASKMIATSKLKDRPAVSLIHGILELNYLENKGAAFGVLQDQKFFLVLIAVLILFMICYILLIVPDEKKYNPIHILLALLSAGAIGNMIDRLINGYVVDFIYFVIINFPIFNVADIYVTVSCAVLVLLFLFYYNEHDLAFISITRQDRFREMK